VSIFRIVASIVVGVLISMPQTAGAQKIIKIGLALPKGKLGNFHSIASSPASSRSMRSPNMSRAARPTDACPHVATLRCQRREVKDSE